MGLVDWRPAGQPPVLHSNSLYVEILVTLGLAGAVCFAWLLLSLGRRVLNLLKRLLAHAAVNDVAARLLYTSDAADERSSVDLGGPRIS